MNDPHGTDAASDGSGPAEEPEQLLSEALRAQARSAPDSAPSAPAGQDSTTSTDPPPPGYGLLSGAEAGSLERERAALDGAQDDDPPPHEAGRSRADSTKRVKPSLAAGWVLLLAVLLGLAAGSVVGLLTLLES